MSSGFYFEIPPPRPIHTANPTPGPSTSGYQAPLDNVNLDLFPEVEEEDVFDMSLTRPIDASSEDELPDLEPRIHLHGDVPQELVINDQELPHDPAPVGHPPDIFPSFINESHRQKVSDIESKLIDGELPEWAGLQGNELDDKEYMTSDELEEKFMDMYLRHPSTSQTAASDFLKLAKNYGESINPMLSKCGKLDTVIDRQANSFQTAKRNLLENLPTVYINADVAHKGRTPQEREMFDPSQIKDKDLDKIRGFPYYPKKYYDSNKYFEFRTESYIETKRAIKFLLETHGYHENTPCHVMIGIDGVRENDKFKSPTLEVLYMVLLACPRHAIAVRIGRSTYKHSLIDTADMMNTVIQDIVKMDGQVKVFALVGDKPGRSKINMLKQHASPLCCEYCFIVGEMIHYDDNNPDRAKPSFQWNGPSECKTNEVVRAIMDNFENLSNDERRGYLGRSKLLDLEGFDIVTDVPAEYMHNQCLGVQKRLMNQTYNFPNVPDRIDLLTVERYDLLSYLTDAREVKYPSDFNRGVSKLESAMKAEEYRNYAMGGCLVLISTKSHRQPLVKIQIIFTFLVKTYVMPKAEYERADSSIDLVDLAHYWQEVYQENFHPYFQTYNVHVFCHLKEIRKKGPLTLTSMFAPEGMFSDLLNGICVGTTNIGKQGILRVLMRYNAKHHRCFKRIVYSPYVPGQSKDDSIGYIYDKVEKKHHVWKVVETDPISKTCKAQRVNISPYIAQIGGVTFSKLDMSLCGIYVHQGITDELRQFHYKDFNGKGFIVRNLITLLPKNILNEST